MKKRFADRSEWKRVSKRKYTSMEVSDDDFEGTVTLLKIEEVTEPLIVHYEGKEICIANRGYYWLQHFPDGKPYALTTVFNEEGNLVQWYIDMCLNIENNNTIPYWVDMFLDIVILPSGYIFLLDEEELEEALEAQIVTKEQYDATKQEAVKLLQLIQEDKLKILSLAYIHKNQLEKLV